MLKECPFPTEDEEASKATEPSGGTVSQVAGSTLSEGGVLWSIDLCNNVQRNRGPLERPRGASAIIS